MSMKCLLGRHEGLSSIPITHGKEPDMVTHACDLNAGEVETSGHLGLLDWPASLTD